MRTPGKFRYHKRDPGIFGSSGFISAMGEMSMVARMVQGSDEDGALLALAPELLEIAKRWHGYDDPLHLAALPNCGDCDVIRRAESPVQEKEKIKIKDGK